MDVYAAAIARLREARDALNAMDVPAATRALAEHDRLLREALASEPPRLVRSEGEALALAQGQLLDDLVAVQRGVSAELRDTGRSAAAARAYLGHRGA